MPWQDRIVVDPAILTGKPVIKGTRIAVELILELLAEGWTHDEIERNYPLLTDEDLQAALHYAAEVLKRDESFPATPPEAANVLGRTVGSWTASSSSIMVAADDIFSIGWKVV